MTNNTTVASTNTGVESFRRWTVGAIVGSVFAVLIVVALAFPSVLGTTDDRFRGTSKSRPQSASAAAAAQGQRDLRSIEGRPNGEEVGSVSRQLMDGNIWDITWPSETGEDSDNIFYAAWGPEKDLKSAKDGDELQKVKKSLFGLTETERSVAWELALEEDLTDLRMSYSYGFDMFADELTLFAEDYSYSMSYDL